MKNGMASARYLVELVEFFQRVVREDRGGKELSNVAAFTAGPSCVGDGDMNSSARIVDPVYADPNAVTLCHRCL